MFGPGAFTASEISISSAVNREDHNSDLHRGYPALLFLRGFALFFEPNDSISLNPAMQAAVRTIPKRRTGFRRNASAPPADVMPERWMTNLCARCWCV